VVLFATTLAVSFGPFLLLDWRVLVYGMYGNYVRVIHDFVWTQTDWMRSTIGLTRVLVASGRSQYVGPAQIVVMAIVYALTWWRLRPGVAPAPWFCLALAAFCMTTLWPVWYVFLDVFVLASCFLAADHVPELPRAPWKTIAATGLLTMVALLGTLAVNPGVYYDIEAGKTPRWHFRSGFGPDLEEGGRVFVWATRDRVNLRVPRGFATRSAIEIECDPFSPPGAPAQTLGASLNGSALGQVSLRRGWQTVRFESSARAWRIGHNDLTLYFRYALPAGEGQVRAVRISRVSIVR
jgi:hypothetical protein